MKMGQIKYYFVILLISLLTACATIPQESVDLSMGVGVGLKNQHKSQVDLVNLYFSIKRQMLDKVMEKAVKKYFKGLISTGTITLNTSQLSDIAQDVMELNSKNNAAKEELEKARVIVIKKLNDNYLTLNLANSSITGLLQSVVTVKKARSEAFEALSKATDGKIDLDKIFIELDQFVLNAGEDAGKTIDLIDNIKALID